MGGIIGLPPLLPVITNGVAPFVHIELFGTNTSTPIYLLNCEAKPLDVLPVEHEINRIGVPAG